MIFPDRKEAGRQLAKVLARMKLDRPYVLGLTRGGVPVAFEVARALRTDLDVLVVRKVGAPGFPEYALGAVAEGGAVYANPDALRELGLSVNDLGELADREAAEVVRRLRTFRGDRPAPNLAGRTAVVVDDGVATGATAMAAGRAARMLGAARTVLASPVIAAQSAPALRAEFDEVVAVDYPEEFMAVGLWYERFEQLSDEDVLDFLRRAREQPAEGEPGELWNGEWMGSDASDPADDPAEEPVVVPFDGSRSGPGSLEGTLSVPEGARGLVLFAHGSGSTRRSPRNRYVAAALQRAGFATLLFDLLTPEEAAVDEVTGELRFEIDLLAERVVAATRWARAAPRTRALHVGLFGSSTGAAAALEGAAALPDDVAAVVSRGGRPDLVPPEVLRAVRAPTLLVVGGRDFSVLEMNRSVLPCLAHAELAVVPRATHLFEEPGTLDAVVNLAAEWFDRHLAGALEEQITYEI
jgi:putative phosphoribosyl transferase